MNEPDAIKLNNDVIIINNKHSHLRKDNFLGEFRTDLEKSLARHNLGIDKIVTQIYKDMGGNGLVKALTSEEYKALEDAGEISQEIIYIITD